MARIRALPFRTAAAATVAVLVAALGGCTAAPEPPEQPSSLARLAAALEEFGNEMLDDGAPAVLIQAKVRGEEWSRASGVRSLEGREPLEIDNPMPIGRVTESFVAVSVLKLAVEGRLGLEDPVSQHLPDFESIMHPPGPVTIRRLLQHESGMPDYLIPLLQQGSLGEVLATGRSHRELLALAATQRWEPRLAQGHEYSGSNYIALGMIVERLRGLPIGDVLRSDITEPLGLTTTWMTERGPAPPSLVHGYVTSSGERLDVSYPPIPRRRSCRGPGVQRRRPEHVLRRAARGPPDPTGHGHGHADPAVRPVRDGDPALERYLHQQLLLRPRRGRGRLRHYFDVQR
ncbi:serine hydrolase [Arthrobacter sp. Y81]|uniref:serine hydrolase domain-containing protein n=1 Tax=Arthrobacter sp. Y81 TaxID=2058897 RepID=UPI0021574792|nr:serine hydrolase [Arthrobacter sp. Y81]